MNLLLLERDEVSDDRVVIHGPRASHMRRVLGVQPGRRLRAGVVRGATGHVVVRTLRGSGGDDPIELDVVIPQVEISAPTVSLIVALPRPKVAVRSVEIAASMGVSRIDFVNAWRVDKSYFGAKRIESSALCAAARRGCAQGGLTWVPDICVHRLLMRYLHQATWGSAVCALAHPRAPNGHTITMLPKQSSNVLAIGPERGWIDRELASFAEAGFIPIHFGVGVLRVEAAIACGLGQLALARGSGIS